MLTFGDCISSTGKPGVKHESLSLAVERLGGFAEALITNGRPADTPVLIVQDGTTRIERSVAAKLSMLLHRKATVSTPRKQGNCGTLWQGLTCLARSSYSAL